MDVQNTLTYFYGNAGESKSRFLELLECSYRVARATNLEKFRNDHWNPSVPKIIDNIILKINGLEAL